jgi:hypothetical protein
MVISYQSLKKEINYKNLISSKNIEWLITIQEALINYPFLLEVHKCKPNQGGKDVRRKKGRTCLYL